MRKGLMTILAAFMLLGSVFTPVATAKNENAKQSLVALGDSITFGYNLGNNQHPSKDAFPAIMGKEADMRVRNLGMSGWGTEQLLTALKHDEKFRQAVRHADVVTLEIGSTDFLQGLLASNGDPEVLQGFIDTMLQNLDAIISEIQSLTNAKIIVYNIFNPFQVNQPVHGLVDYLLPPVNSGIEDVVQSSGGNIAYADADGAFGDDQAIYVIQGDNHPTALGHEVLAEIGLETLVGQN